MRSLHFAFRCRSSEKVSCPIPAACSGVGTLPATSGQLVPKLWGACQRRNTPQEWGRKPFRRERQRKAKWRKHMRENPYKRLPPIERRQDGSLYRMTPAPRKQANALLCRECCCYEDGNCMLLDEGDTHTCPQTISFSVCCKWFRWSVLPQIGTLEAEIFRDKELKRCAICGRVFVPKSNRAKYCPDCAARVHRRQKTESERKRRSCVDS